MNSTNAPRRKTTTRTKKAHRKVSIKIFFITIGKKKKKLSHHQKKKFILSVRFHIFFARLSTQNERKLFALPCRRRHIWCGFDEHIFSLNSVTFWIFTRVRGEKWKTAGSSELTPSHHPRSRGFPDAFFPCVTEFLMIFMSLITAKKCGSSELFFTLSASFFTFFSSRLSKRKNFLLLGLLGSRSLFFSLHNFVVLFIFFLVFIYSRIWVRSGDV